MADNQKFSKILVTGAMGKVGERALPRLADDFPFFATDLRGGKLWEMPVQSLDITDFSAVMRAMEGVDCVLHLAIASLRSFPERNHPPEKRDPFEDSTLAVNVEGTYNLFEAARRHKVRRIIYFSSLTTVLSRPKGDSIAPEDPYRPVNVYGVTKLFGEQLAQVFHTVHGIEVITFRLGQPYPTGSDNDWHGWGSRAGRSNYAHMDDVTLAIRCGLTTDVRYGVYNLVSANEYQRIPIFSGHEIGFKPTKLFTEHGILPNEPY